MLSLSDQGRDTVQGAEVGESGIRRPLAPQRSPRLLRVPFPFESSPSLEVPQPWGPECVLLQASRGAPHVSILNLVLPSLPPQGGAAWDTRCLFCPMRLLTPRLYSQVAEGRPSSLTFAALSGFLGVRGEEMLRVLPEQATVSSFGVLMATVSLLKQWECSAPLRQNAPGKGRHLSPPIQSPTPSSSLPPLKISLQETSRLSGTHFIDSDPHPPCTSSMERWCDCLPGPTLGGETRSPWEAKRARLGASGAPQISTLQTCLV